MYGSKRPIPKESKCMSALPHHVLREVFTVMPWQQRLQLTTVCKSWYLACSDVVSWTRIFLAAHGTETPLLRQFTSHSSTRWFCDLIIADAFGGAYPLVTELDELLGTPWGVWSLRSTDLVPVVADLDRRLQEAMSTVDNIPPKAKALQDMAAMREIAPHVDLWAAGGLDLVCFQRTFVPNLSKVLLQSLEDSKSALLVQLQSVLHKVLGRLLQDTHLDILEHSFRTAPFRTLVEWRVADHADIYKQGWDELHFLVERARDLSDVMATDLTQPAASCIKEDGRVDRVAVKGFVKTAEAVRSALQPMREGPFSYIVVPWEEAVGAVLKAVAELEVVSGMMQCASEYYTGSFIIEHYPDDALSFRELHKMFVDYMTGFEPGSTLYDVCYARSGDQEIKRFTDAVEQLDRQHVIGASLAYPPSYFLSYQDIRHYLLRSPFLTALPSDLLHCLLPIVSSGAVQVLSKRKGDITEVYGEGRTGLRLSKPLLIKEKGDEPLKEKPSDRDIVWSINRPYHTDMHSIAKRYPPHLRLYNTAPLWMAQLAYALKAEGQAILKAAPRDGTLPIDQVAAYPSAYSQVAVALWATSQVEQLGEEAVGALTSALKECVRKARDSPSNTESYGKMAAALVHYIKAAKGEALFVRYKYRASPLGMSRDELTCSLADGEGGVLYGCCVLQHPTPSYFSLPIRAVAAVLQRVERHHREDSLPILCLELQADTNGYSPPPFNAVAACVANSLGRCHRIVQCKDLTEETLLRYFVASVSSGWVIFLQGLNHLPRSLGAALRQHMSLLKAVRKGWDSVREWGSWPIREFPVAQGIGLSPQPFVLASLEDDPAGEGPYQHGTAPLPYNDAEVMEQYLPWEIVPITDMLWVPSESVTATLATHITEAGGDDEYSRIEALWEALRELAEQTDTCTMQGKVLRRLVRFAPSTRKFCAAFSAFVADLSRETPRCLQHAPEPVDCSSPTWSALETMLTPILDDAELRHLTHLVQSKLHTPRPPPVLFPALRSNVASAWLRQGYKASPDMVSGAVSMLILSHFIPVMLALTSSPIQALCQGLSATFPHCPYARTSHLILIHETQSLGPKGSIVKAVEEAHAKCLSAGSVGWVVMYLTERTLRLPGAAAELAAIARDRTVPSPCNEWDPAEGSPGQQQHTVPLKENAKLLLVADRQHAALDTLLPYVLPLRLSFMSEQQY